MCIYIYELQSSFEKILRGWAIDFLKKKVNMSQHDPRFLLLYGDSSYIYETANYIFGVYRPVCLLFVLRVSGLYVYLRISCVSYYILIVSPDESKTN